MDLLIPKHCAPSPIIPWQCHQLPESCLFLLFHPLLPGAIAGKGGGCRCSRRAMTWVADAQPVPFVPACWCVLTVPVRAPRSVSPCAMQQAKPTLMPHHCAMKAGLWLSQEGYLDVWPLPFSGVLYSLLLPGVQGSETQISLPSQSSATVTWALLSSLPPLCPTSFLLSHRGWGDIEGPGAGRAGSCTWLLQGCPCVWHGPGRSSCPSLPCLQSSRRRTGAG